MVEWSSEGWGESKTKLRCLCFRTDYYVIIHLIDDFFIFPKVDHSVPYYRLPYLQKHHRRVNVVNDISFFLLLHFFTWICQHDNDRKKTKYRTTYCHRYDLLPVLCHYLFTECPSYYFSHTIAAVSLKK